jgi:hypothetical protein
MKKTDPSHTRVPGECFFPDVALGEASLWSKKFSCPGCKSRRHRYDETHTNNNGECRWANSEELVFGGRVTGSLGESLASSSRRGELRRPALDQRSSPTDPARDENDDELALDDVNDDDAMPGHGIRGTMRPSGDAETGFDYDETLDAATGFDHEAQAVFGIPMTKDPTTQLSATTARTTKLPPTLRSGWLLTKATVTTENHHDSDDTKVLLPVHRGVVRTGTDGQKRRTFQRPHVRHYHQSAAVT